MYDGGKVAVLTEQSSYDGAQLDTERNQLKMKSPKDGKRYKTDIANTEQLLRMIQSIPSGKAEPFKMWQATPQTMLLGNAVVGMIESVAEEKEDR